MVLQELTLCSNKIEEKDVEKLVSLKILRVYNNFKYIPRTLINLEELHIDGCYINTIPDTLVNLKILFCNAKMEKIPDTLVNLEILGCSYTNIDQLPDTLVNLKRLDCSGTKIKKIPDTFVSLKILDCVETCINDVPSNIKLEEFTKVIDW